MPGETWLTRWTSQWKRALYSALEMVSRTAAAFAAGRGRTMVSARTTVVAVSRPRARAAASRAGPATPERWVATRPQ